MLSFFVSPQVRELVKFVRKRDKRVKAYLEQLKEKQQERLQDVQKQRQKARLEREMMLDQYKEQDWASMAGLEEDLEQMSKHLDSEFGEDNGECSDQSEEEIEQFYCVACDKSFKSGKALHNHEKSRKHKENVQLIKREMAQQGDDANDENEFFNESFDEQSSRDESFVSVGELELTDSLDLYEMKIKATNRHKVKELHSSCRNRALSGIEENLPGVEEAEIADESTSQNENEPQMTTVCNGENSGHPHNIVKPTELELDTDIKKEKKLTKKRNVMRQSNLDLSDSDADSVEETVKCISGEKANVTAETVNTAFEPEQDHHGTGHFIETTESSTGSVANKTNSGQKSSEMRKKENKDCSRDKSKKQSDQCQPQWLCNVCRANFPSRNKLFQHVKKEGHALKVDGNDREANNKPNKKKGKRKK